MIKRSGRLSIAAVLLFCASAAFPQASDLPLEANPSCAPFPQCLADRLVDVYPKTSAISVIQGTATVSASPGGLGSPWMINESLYSTRETLQVTGGFLDIPQIGGFGFPQQFVISATNTSTHPWTAFEIELQPTLGQPSGNDGLSFGTLPGGSLLVSPTATKFGKLQFKVACTSFNECSEDGRDVLLFSDGIVNPGETVTFKIPIRQRNPYLTSFYIVQRPLPLLVVTTDLKPKDDPNCVNPASSGSVPVAVFGSATFQVSAINQSTLRFGGAPPLSCAIDNVPMEGPALVFKKDDYPDLVCHFSTQQVSWPVTGTNAGVVGLTGSLSDGTPTLGFDTASIAGEFNCTSGTPTFPIQIPIPQAPADYLTFSKGPLSFTIKGPGYTAGPDAVTVSSSKGPMGSLSIPFVNTSNGINWLNAGVSASNILTLSVANTSALVIPVRYTGTVTVRSDGDPETDSVLNVGLQVGTCSGLVATPPSWSITLPPFPSPLQVLQTFTLKNADGFVVPAAGNVIDFRSPPFVASASNNADGTVTVRVQAWAVAGSRTLGLINPYCFDYFGVRVPVTVTIGP